MSHGGAYAVTGRGPFALGTGALRLIVALSAVGAFGVGIALGLYRYPLSLGAVFALGLGLLAMLAFAIARYDAAVALGFALLSVNQSGLEPSDIVFAVVIAVAVVTGRFDLRRVPLTATVLVGLFLALNLFSAIEVTDGARALHFLPITIYVGILALWVASYAHSASRTRGLVRGYVVGAVASAGVGTLALFVPFPGHEQFVFQDARALGLFEDPNFFGASLVPAALILIEEIASPRLLRSSRTTKAVLFLVLVLGILFSYSRGAWLSFVLGIGVMLVVLGLRRGGGRATAVLSAIVLTATAALAFAIVITGSATFLEERAQFQAYDVDRFEAQLRGIEIADQYPLGIGPGQFELVSPVSAHSTYVRALAEEGFLGVGALLGLFLATFLWAIRNAVAGRDTYGIGSATLLAAWSGMLASSLFVDTLHYRLLWVIAGLIWAGTVARRAFEARSGAARPA